MTDEPITGPKTEPITGPADVPTTDVDMITIPRVRKFTGGMGACALLTVFATVMVLYTVTADESEWVQAAALLVSATVVVLFLRITGAGGSGRRSPQRRREAGSSGPGHCPPPEAPSAPDPRKTSVHHPAQL